MDIPAWIWFMGGIGFLVIELLTPTFFFGMVGVGALIASLFDLISPNEIVTLIVFIIASGGAAYLAWKYDIYLNKEQTLKSGTDRLIDKKGVVEEKIDSSEGTGIVKVEGERWRAKSKYNEIIESGEEVIVDDIEGTTLIVWELRESMDRTIEEEI